MKFDEMTVEELEARQAEIAGMSTEEATTEEIDARAAELEAIRDELQARANAAAKAEAERKAVADGAGETREEHKEEKRMEISEIRNSPEYIEAYANYIKTENDSECRALLTENVNEEVYKPVSPVESVKMVAVFNVNIVIHFTVRCKPLADQLLSFFGNRCRCNHDNIDP
jgi:hypothetical protein